MLFKNYLEFEAQKRRLGIWGSKNRKDFESPSAYKKKQKPRFKAGVALNGKERGRNYHYKV